MTLQEAVLRQRSRAQRLAWAVLSVAVAGLVRWIFAPLVGGKLPWMTFALATLVSTVVGARTMGMLAAVLGAAAGTALSVTYGMSLHPLGGPDIVSVAAYLLAAGGIVLVGDAVRTAFLDLEAERARLAAVLEVGRVGYWDMDLRSGVGVQSSTPFERPGPGPSATPMEFRQWREWVHPDDRERVEAEWRRALRERTDFRAEYRLRLRDDSMHWVYGSGRFVYEPDGTPARALGAFYETTDLKRADEAERLLSFHAENSPLAIVEWGVDYRVTRWSADAERIFGWTADEVLGKRFDAFPLVYEDDVAKVDDVLRSMNDGTATRNVSLNRNRRKDGRVIHCAWYNSALRDGAGNVVSVYSQVLDRTREVEALEALREADRRKDEFLAMLAHELRNPLAPIRNAVHVLRSLGAEGGPAGRARDMIDRQVSHMARLIDDLLEVSRITRGLIALRKEPLSLADVVRDAVETTRPMVEQHEHTLSVTLDDEPISLDGDRARLVQVVSNVLANAAKFTPAGGHISLVTERVGPDRAVVTIRDTGIGVPEELRDRVFDLFAQEDAGLSRSQGGLGIGLTLVKRLVEMHGGDVTLTSEGRNRGTLVRITLPVAQAAQAHRPRETTYPVATASEARALRILVVEDNPDTRESLEVLLELDGHEVRAVASGVKTLRLLDDFRPDVAFIDLGLPDMDGYELARRLRADPRTTSALLVAVSGYGRDEDKVACRHAGFDGHLTKPVELAVFRDVLAGRGPGPGTLGYTGPGTIGHLGSAE
jgi:PAS domain S-box-containing protein